MKKAFALVALVGLAALRVASTAVYADTTSTATTQVHVTINPNIAVSATQQVWDLGTYQNGSISATTQWRVDANVEAVQFCLQASDLFKGGDPTNTDVPPIPLDSNSPALISGEHANEINGGDNRALWVGAGPTVNNFPTKKTESVTYESSQSGHFSQVVTTTVTYNQNDPEKPQGQYSGVIKLLALIPPNNNE